MSDIECIYYKSINKGVFVASVNIFVPKWGIEITGLTLCMKNGKRWINFPSKEYEKDGEKKYFPYFRFREKNHHEGFQHKVIVAIEQYCQNHQSEDKIFEEEVPF